MNSTQINIKNLLIGTLAIASVALLAYTIQQPKRNKKRKDQTSKRKRRKDEIIKTFNTTPIDIHLAMENTDGFNGHIAADRKNIKVGLKYGSKLIKINRRKVTDLPYEEIVTILSRTKVPMTLSFIPIPTLHKQWTKAFQLKEEANEHFKNGFIKQAIKTVSNAIKLHPTNKTFYSNRILMYLTQHQYDNALNDCKIIRDLDPLSLYVKGHYLRGLTLFALKKYKHAAYAFQTILKLQPTFKKAKHRFNQCLEKQKQRDELELSEVMDIRKYEFIDVETIQLINGYIRSMQKLIDDQMKNLIIPPEINKICGVFFYIKSNQWMGNKYPYGRWISNVMGYDHQ
eukprot:443692_1